MGMTLDNLFDFTIDDRNRDLIRSRLCAFRDHVENLAAKPFDFMRNDLCGWFGNTL